jgi:hypothetical protein
MTTVAWEDGVGGYEESPLRRWAYRLRAGKDKRAESGEALRRGTTGALSSSACPDVIRNGVE